MEQKRKIKIRKLKAKLKSKTHTHTHTNYTNTPKRNTCNNSKNNKEKPTNTINNQLDVTKETRRKREKENI